MWVRDVSKGENTITLACFDNNKDNNLVRQLTCPFAQHLYGLQ